MGELVSVNVGRPREAAWAVIGRTSIDKAAVSRPVDVGRRGLEGDQVSDTRHHGGADQAVYAFAREDLDTWERVLGETLPDGVFGENLTTRGLDVNDAEIGERWRVGDDLVLEVSSPRTPCRDFRTWVGRCGYDERAWVRRFTEAGRPGPYLRVLVEGTIRVGDPVEVIHRPGHGVTVTTVFRALTSERHLLGGLLGIEGISARVRRRAEEHLAGRT